MTKDWSTEPLALTQLEIPDGSQAVDNGFLWQDYHNLYLYGGQFSDLPYVDPAPESLWRHSIKGKGWTEFTDSEASDGNFSAPGGEPVRRAAEGAGVPVPELGLSGFLVDIYCRLGYRSRQAQGYRPRLSQELIGAYTPWLGTLILESTRSRAAQPLPMVASFAASPPAVFKKTDFPGRADGVLVFVLGLGHQGVLIGLAGGTADTFTHN